MVSWMNVNCVIGACDMESQLTLADARRQVAVADAPAETGRQVVALSPCRAQGRLCSA